MILSVAIWCAMAAADVPETLKREDIIIRDPFVLPVAEEGRYYLYGTGKPLGEIGFDAYSSKDLEHWEGPFAVFRAPEGFWGKKLFWAPEVFRYRGRYYLFGTFATENEDRGTQICVSDSPRGPFVPLGDRAQTPPEWKCLDGTLFIDDKAQPWMVFCHEWIQVGDGEICAVRLTEDLSAPIGEPILLFKASSVSWGRVSNHRIYNGRVTDGPWLHRAKNGALLMIWSTFQKGGSYTVTLAKSDSAKIEGPWLQAPAPLFGEDGGHAMLFTGFDGQLRMSLHQPNRSPSHPVFLPVEEKEGNLSLVTPSKQP